MNPPELTKNELEQFLNRVKKWEKDNVRLNHIWFEPAAMNYVRDNGYKFEPGKDEHGHCYHAVKL